MKHWVFDLDCTLVDSGGNYDRHIAKIFKHFGLSCTEEDLKKAHNYFGPVNFFSMYLSESQADEAVEMLVHLDFEDSNRIECFPGVHDLLESLAPHVALSVWTGRDRASSERILELTGLNKYFGNLKSRTCVERTKPHPDGLLKILSESQHQGDEVVMIGDHEYDVRGARAAGVMAVSISWKGPEPHPLAILSDKHFYRVEDLARWAKDLYLEPSNRK